MQSLGIDLGTTNSVVSVERRVLPISDRGHTTLPSVVGFLPNGTISVGDTARRRRAIDSSNTIYSSKRIIGRRYDDGQTRNFIERYPFEIVELPGGWPAFRTRAGEFSPTQVAERILREVVQRADVDPQRCEVVLAVPANFSNAQRQATADAAISAGLGCPHLIDEPSATALAYLHSNHPCRRALVYDLGGGTFDCAVLDCSKGAPRMVSHASDLQLGGDDIDYELARWVARLVLEKHNWDLANYSETWDRLLAHCEDAKIALSVDREAPIFLSQVDPECPSGDEAVVLTQTILEEICQSLVSRSFIACDDVLRMAGLRPPDIDAVFLAGGTSFLPVIQHGVQAYFGRSGFIEFDPTEVVAIGAGIASSC